MSEPDEAAQEAAWREIVENFGERVDLPEQPEQPEQPGSSVPEARGPADFDDDVDESFAPDTEAYDDVYEHDRFVAPRPSLPRTTPERFAAWLGVLGSPVIAILLVIAHQGFGWWIPTWVVYGLVLAFLAGFGYLVLAMPREPRDPWDDGARL